MEPAAQATRVVFWNIEHVWVMYALLVPTFGVFGYGMWTRLQRWLKGKPVLRTDRLGERIQGFFRDVAAQAQVRKNAFAGLFHLILSWGFVVLFLGTAVVFIHQDLRLEIMQGGFYLWFQSLAVDTFGLLFVIGLGLALYRRYVMKPRALTHGLASDGFFLGTLFMIGVTGFLIEGIRIVVTDDPWGLWSPVGYATGQLFAWIGLGADSLRAWHVGLWWFHLVVVYAWIAYLPYSKALHIITSPASIFFRNLDPPGRLDTLDIENMEEDAVLGVKTLTDFHWKDLLDLDACTECGRCQEACPAFAVDKPLNPKQLILDMQQLQRCPDPDQPIVGGAIDLETLWSCTTCMACVEACPVEIEHVSKIVGMRRYQVMEEGAIEEPAQQALQGVEDRGHPFRGSQASRTDWYKDLPFVREMSDVGKAEVLFWVGCAVAMNERSQNIARATATILHRAGVDFAVLGDEETCTGDPARRMGNEYLFQMQAEQNIETLNNYGVQTVVTTCPHCMNTLKNEYREFGGDYEVVHHSQMIEQLLAEGRLQIDPAVEASVLKQDAADSGAAEAAVAAPADGAGNEVGATSSLAGEQRPTKPRITFHDPCYLGRYEGEYDAPRRVIVTATGGASANGTGEGAGSGSAPASTSPSGAAPVLDTQAANLLEMARSRNKGFCCGAGGGRYWMDDQPGQRINVERAREAADTGADIVATGCPFCMLMMEDGLKTVEAESGKSAVTKDIAEIVAEALQDS